MVSMVQERRGHPGSLKRQADRLKDRSWMNASEPSQLDRIEAKLDALLEVLADEGEDAQQEYTLDGEAVGRERDDSQPL